MTKARSILITGCSSGIGEYCATALKADGWSVFATARNREDIDRLNRAGLVGLHLDYCDQASIEAAFGQVMEETGGKLDALFNNGAYGQAGAVEDLPTDVLRQQFEANFFGWHHLTNLCVPVMRKNGHGRIVHCSSVLGLVPYPWRGAYNASKFALEGLASTMRLELAGSGISVSLIEPGPIVSKFTINGLPHFLEKIDRDASPHRDAYVDQVRRLEENGGVNRFRLGPEAVYKALDHALNHKKPKPHYSVTVPTHAMAWAKRLLPHRLMDRILKG